MIELAAFVAFWSTGGWIWSRITGRMDVADVLWGPGIAVLSLIALEPRSGFSYADVVFLAGLLMWASRLALHISRRNARKSEDARYAAWRRDWGPQVEIRSYLQVFVLQTILMLPMAAPAFAIAGSDGGFGWFQWAGLALYAIGFAIESVADRQLADFLRQPDNKGRVMDRGLWSASRHPNYLGEVILWWGLGLMGGPAGLIASATITWLILKVSGVPLLERKWALDPKYDDYRRNVPEFWPWSSKTTTS